MTRKFVRYSPDVEQKEPDYTPSAEINLLDEGTDRYFGIRSIRDKIAVP